MIERDATDPGIGFALSRPRILHLITGFYAHATAL